MAVGGNLPLAVSTASELLPPAHRERGIVARVTAILRRTPVRAILCECTELPAFSDALRTATSLPVFDVVTCLDFFHSARNRSFHSAVRHHVSQGIERKLSSEAETAVLPPVRLA